MTENLTGSTAPDAGPPPGTPGAAAPGATTGTATTAPPPPLPPPPPPFLRSREGRVFRGVCAGLGRATGTDPVLWRVLVVVLAFLGGTGVVLYLAAWLLVPEEGAGASEAQRLARGQSMGTGALLALAALILFAWFAVFGNEQGLLAVLLLGALALVVARNRSGTGAAADLAGQPPTGAAAWDAPPAWSAPAGSGWPPPPPSGSWGPAPGGSAAPAGSGRPADAGSPPPGSGAPSAGSGRPPAGYGPPPGGYGPPPGGYRPPPGGYGPPPGGFGPPPPGFGPPAGMPPAPPAQRSPLGPLTLSVVALVVGGLLLAGALGLDGVTAPRVLAAALLVTGLGLLVGTRWGRARGLIAVAAVLALALGATSGVDRSFGTSTGQRTWAVAGSAEHRLGAGDAVLDLRPLAGTARRNLSVDARVGAGQLVVLVPEDLRVQVDARVGLGELVLPERGRDDDRRQGGPGVEDEVELGPAGYRNVRLDVSVGIGSLEVRHVG